MPLSAAPVFPNPAQLYRPTGLFSVALMYWRSRHSSIFCMSFSRDMNKGLFYTHVGLTTQGRFFRLPWLPTSGSRLCQSTP